MGSSGEKKRQQELKDRDAAAQAAKETALVAAAKPSPLEEKRDAMTMEDLDYFNKAVPDYSVAPKGMIDSTAFSRAAMNRLRDREGIGGAAMGTYGADPTLMAMSRERQDNAQAQEGGAAYADNLSNRRAQAIGGSDALMSMALSRSMGVAGMRSQDSQNAANNYANFKPQPSFWAQLALAGVQGASSIASSYVGKP